MGKKGQGHIEVMLSFVLFLGFLIFVFIFFNPLSSSVEKSNNIETIKNAIIQNVTEEIGKISVIKNQLKDCYNLTSLISIYGDKFVNVSSGDLRKYNVYFSDFFPSASSPACTSNNFTYGVYSKEKFVAYENLMDLNSSYASDYDNLRKNLGITNDFSFSLRDFNNNKIISAERFIPSSINVQSDDIPVRVINKSGVVSEKILNIRIW